MKNKSWRVSKKEAGMRLLQFLREKCPEAQSVKALKRAIDSKLCTVNNRTETFSSYELQENDKVSLNERAFEKKPEKLKVTVLYEDDVLQIINKPAGLVSDAESLKLLPVHRLDKETTGVLILAKSKEMKDKMAALFKERAVHKLYLAIVDGVVAKDEGTIDNYLGKKHAYEGQTVYGAVDINKGLRAITHWKCLKRGKTASLLSCEPHTGRTHQLRVHLSGMGHPILGDVQYGKRFRCSVKPPRNMLHAYSIQFKHPKTGKELKIIAPIPLDFKECLSECGLSQKAL